VLRASKRVLKAGGKMVFTVIGTIDDSSSPPGNFDGYVTPAPDYEPMMRQAGFNHLTQADVTPAFHATALRWLTAASDLEADLREVLGDQGYDDKVASRTETFDAIEAGDIRRLLITAVA
jgi:hypothetical protein